MSDMLEQITEMDERVRQITDAAQKQKIDTGKEISGTREDIRSRYLTRARARVERNRPLERTTAEKAWQVRGHHYHALVEQLDQQYAQSGEKWVNTIVSNMIGE